MDIIKDHFEGEAKAWDSIVLERVPHYREMLDTLVSMLPFQKDKSISVADLGAGSGTIGYLIKSRFPNARIKCIDLSPSMLETAREKLSGFLDIDYEQADLSKYEFKDKFDAIVSSLALHHLDPNMNKAEFYKKAYKALNSGGIFVNADIILGSDDATQKFYLSKWKEFLLKHLSEEKTEENHQRYLREDRPNMLLTEIEWLKNAGFKDVDAYFKYFNFAVYGGRK
jgi:tRNA (cmo5U34)-methyltransferase